MHVDVDRSAHVVSMGYSLEDRPNVTLAFDSSLHEPPNGGGMAAVENIAGIFPTDAKRTTCA